MEPTQITDVDVREMSAIYRNYKGQEWRQINPGAQVLSVKGAAVVDDGRKTKSFLGDLWEKAKAAVTAKAINADAIAESVKEIAEDQASWSALCWLIDQVNYDLSLIFAADAFTDEERRAAVQRALGGFGEAVQKLLPILLGTDADTTKAGAKHSKETKAHIDAMSEAHKTMGEHLDALKSGVKKDDANDSKGAALEVQTMERDGNVVVTAVGVQGQKGEPIWIEIAKADYDDAEKRDAALKQLEEKATSAKSAPANTLTVASAFNTPAASATAFTVTAKADTAVAELIAKATADFDAKIAAAKTESEAAIKAQVDAAKADAQAQIDAAKAAAETQAAELKTQVEAANLRAETTEKAIKAMGAEAAKPSAPGFVPTVDEDGRHDPAKEANKASALNTEPRSIADVIALQRIAAL